MVELVLQDPDQGGVGDHADEIVGGHKDFVHGVRKPGGVGLLLWDCMHVDRRGSDRITRFRWVVKMDV